MSERPVEVRGLVKRYGPNPVVDDVDLTVEAGDIYGYLGPNGAGKTATLRMTPAAVRAAWTCALYSLIPLVAGWVIFARRDVAGA
jgi:ABC-2 type transport system ATP-binding protein